MSGLSVKWERLPTWSPELEAGLSKTLRRDRAAIVAGVNGGWLEAYRINSGEAYMITRVEKGVLTCCCFQGRGVAAVMQWMWDRCEALGLTDIVFFTQRPALARLLKQFHFELDDYVFRARVGAEVKP